MSLAEISVLLIRLIRVSAGCRKSASADDAAGVIDIVRAQLVVIVERVVDANKVGIILCRVRKLPTKFVEPAGADVTVGTGRTGRDWRQWDLLLMRAKQGRNDR